MDTKHTTPTGCASDIAGIFTDVSEAEAAAFKAAVSTVPHSAQKGMGLAVSGDELDDGAIHLNACMLVQSPDPANLLLRTARAALSIATKEAKSANPANAPPAASASASSSSDIPSSASSMSRHFASLRPPLLRPPPHRL